jgi:hypothetical protein
MGIKRTKKPVDGSFDQLLGIDILDVVLLGQAQYVVELDQLIVQGIIRCNIVDAETNNDSYNREEKNCRQHDPS